MRMAGMVAFLCVLLGGPVASAEDPGMSPERLIHRSVAVVTSIERDAGFLVIRQDDGQVLRIYVDKTSAGDSLEALQPGDIIREECTKCTKSSSGSRIARRILLSPTSLERGRYSRDVRRLKIGGPSERSIRWPYFTCPRQTETRLRLSTAGNMGWCLPRGPWCQ